MDIVKIGKMLSPENTAAFYFAMQIIAASQNNENEKAQEPASLTHRLTAEKRERLRASIVRHIWTCDLRSDLVDRAVDLVDSGVVTIDELKKSVFRSAKRTDPWKDFGRAVKGWTARAGIPWTPTTAATEPEPPRRPSVVQATIAKLEG